MGIVVVGAVFVDIKGYPNDLYVPTGRNPGRIDYVHGGVARNVVEDIANVELRPTYLGIVDDGPLGAAVIQKLKNHKVDTQYIPVVPDSMGTWLAVFDHQGDLAGSISKRPNMMPLLEVLEEHGDEIFANCDSVVVEIDIEKDVVKAVINLAKKYDKKITAVVSNMQIAAQRRDLLQKIDCLICNQLEAGILFADDYMDKNADEMQLLMAQKVKAANYPCLIVTLGEKGAVYADINGNSGFCPARKVHVKDTTGAGDSYCAGVAIGLTYGKTMEESMNIGTTLAASVIASYDNVCPRFMPAEFGIDAAAYGIDVE